MEGRFTIRVSDNELNRFFGELGSAEVYKHVRETCANLIREARERLRAGPHVIQGDDRRILGRYTLIILQRFLHVRLPTPTLAFQKETTLQDLFFFLYLRNLVVFFM